LLTLGVLSLGSGGAVLFALGAFVLRKWFLGEVVARRAFFVSGTVFAFLALVLVLMMLIPGIALLVLPFQIGGEDVDPSQKARVLAETISEMINTGALSALVAPLSGVVWWIAHRRVRVAGRGAG
jgi:hypothetical protein